MSAKQSNYAVIDVGTNTFHLLIARFHAKEARIEAVYRERRFVKLAEQGIDRIIPAAQARGLEALSRFSRLLPDHGVRHHRVVGTAALRTAANGPAFIEAVRRRTGLRIETVSGLEEARLIYRGVSLAVPFDQQYRLIVDLGGGSVECMLANARGVAWAQSFPVGLAVLSHRFYLADPMPTEAFEAMNQWLDEELRPLDEALKKYPPADMVGASGTFDILDDLFGVESPGGGMAIPVAAIEGLSTRLAPSTIAQRLRMPDIPSPRADLITLALALILHLARRARLSRVIHSAYAMKEGILRDMLEPPPTAGT